MAVILAVINSIPQLCLAQAKGFKLKPMGFSYLLGAIGNVISGNLVPLSAQVETISLAGLLKKPGERVTALLIAAVFGIFLGLSGGTSAIVEFTSPALINGMMAGVGIFLCYVAIDLMIREKRTGVISIITALVTWFFCNRYEVPNSLVWIILVSVTFSTLDFLVLQRRRVDLTVIFKESKESDEFRFWKKSYWSGFKLIKPCLSLPSILGGFALICLNIAGNISFGSINASIAGETPRLNALTVINSLADLPSVVFGGAPIETIISGTAAAPWPLTAGAAMMLVCALLLLAGVIGRLGKYIPSASVSGFLLVIGFFLTFVPNLKSVISAVTGS